MKQIHLFFLVLLGLLLSAHLDIGAQRVDNITRCAVNITVTEKGTKEPIVMATCALVPLEARTVTNADGKAQLRNVRAETTRSWLVTWGMRNTEQPLQPTKTLIWPCNLRPPRWPYAKWW